MIRTLTIIVALLIPSAAFACGDKKCGEGSCPMAAHATPPAGDSAAVATAPGTHAVLEVAGMSCGNCSSKVQAALSKVAGVNAAAVSHSTGKAEVAFDATKTNAEALAKIVDELGYDAKVATN